MFDGPSHHPRAEVMMMVRSRWLRCGLFGAAGALALVTLAACKDESPKGPSTDPPSEDPTETQDPLLVADKMDLLLVVDNSMSMADKQEILAPSVARLIENLVNPRCVDESGAPLPSASQPTDPSASCPSGSSREHTPVRDLHVGVISSSLGAVGGNGCDSAAVTNPDDRAHLLTRGPVATVPTYQDLGYLDWDPGQTHLPVPGEADLGALESRLRDLVIGVGELGCGYEMPLEAAYRFLADPAPYESLVLDESTGLRAPVGVDQTLLAQRAAFVRPDSLVAVVLLSDENDCSIDVQGPGQLFLNMDPFYRATSICETNPDDACCTSCGLPTPEGCAPDPVCANPRYTDAEDPPNLRCSDTKRRYGVDILNPTARYANALSSASIDPTRSDLAVVEGSSAVDNPLFAGGRPREFVTLTTIVGVPWQDLVTDPTDPTSDLKTSSQMEADGTWSWLLGRDALDPFMRESLEPRTGSSPATHESVSAPNSINGGDYQHPNGYWLQAACTFDLDTAIPDSPSCVEGDSPAQLCDGTTQYAAPAYPGGRQLSVVRALGDRGIAGSVCPPDVGEQVFDPATVAARAHAYNASVDELELRVSPYLQE
ncbi:MAG: hypothetical protein U0271_27965 [Polyangiaceae bacterium]